MPEEVWPWTHFTPQELASNGAEWQGGNSILVNEEAIDTLQHARVLVNKPFTINSAYRAPLWNATVGGVPRSSHKYGIAFDISLKGHDPEILLHCCKKAGFGSFGKYRTFLHVDMRRGNYWGEW